MAELELGGVPGLVALGDSITNGRGEPMLGVHAQSWAQWLAGAPELPFTNPASGRGRPRAAPKPAVAGAIVRALAREAGAAVADLDDLAGARFLLPDAVHPTAVGQVEIAERAAAALAAAGVAVPRSPQALADPARSRRGARRRA